MKNRAVIQYGGSVYHVVIGFNLMLILAVKVGETLNIIESVKFSS